MFLAPGHPQDGQVVFYKVSSPAPPHPSLWEPKSWWWEGQEGPGVGRSATELRKSEPLQGSMVRVLVGSLEERRGNE